MNQFSKFGPLAALGKLWNELSQPQRVVVSIFLIVSIIVVTVVASLATKPRYSVLFSRLESEDAGAIVEKLKDEKTDYRLSDDGTTIEVPSSSVDDLRIKMAMEGLPQGGTVGFEIFDKSSFGLTQFTEKLNYQRAIQGELTRSISKLAPVADARVHITIPDDKVFESEQQPATASIILKLRRGSSLSDDQVSGIVHLVSAAVEGLRPENVTVIDNKGQVLSESTSTTAGGQMLNGSQQKLRRQYESSLSQELQSMLARIVGPDNAVVRVSADLNFDKREITQQVYEPANKANQPGPTKGVVVSEETTSETYSGGVVPPGGIPANANPSGGKANSDNYNRSQTTATYEVTRRTEQTVAAPGAVTRLSVAVLVNDKIAMTEVPKIREAVLAASGLNLQRGDQITVQRIAFDTSADQKMEAEIAQANKMDLITRLSKNGFAVLAVVLFLLFIRKIFRQIRVPENKEDHAPYVPEADNLPSATESVQPEAPTQPIDVPPMPNMESMMAEAFATQSPTSDVLPPEIEHSTPDNLAKLVRTWMTEQ